MDYSTLAGGKRILITFCCYYSMSRCDISFTVVSKHFVIMRTSEYKLVKKLKKYKKKGNTNSLIRNKFLGEECSAFLQEYFD